MGKDEKNLWLEVFWLVEGILWRRGRQTPSHVFPLEERGRAKGLGGHWVKHIQRTRASEKALKRFPNMTVRWMTNEGNGKFFFEVCT